MNAWKPIALVTTAACVFFAVQSPAGADGAVAQGGQPHMQAALAALKTARSELDKAEHDKGGWRAAARQQTQTAIAETERGIQFDAKH